MLQRIKISGLNHKRTEDYAISEKKIVRVYMNIDSVGPVFH